MRDNISLIGYVMASVFTPLTFFFIGLWRGWWYEGILEVSIVFFIAGLLMFTLFITWHIFAKQLEEIRKSDYRKEVTEDLKLLDKYEADFE